MTLFFITIWMVIGGFFAWMVVCVTEQSWRGKP